LGQLHSSAAHFIFSTPACPPLPETAAGPFSAPGRPTSLCFPLFAGFMRTLQDTARWGLTVRSALFPCRRSQSRVRRDRPAPLHQPRPSPRSEIVARPVCLIPGYKARVVSLAPSNRTAPGPPLSGSREEACRRCRRTALRMTSQPRLLLYEVRWDLTKMYMG
jgi:hypothetical protein